MGLFIDHGAEDLLISEQELQSLLEKLVAEQYSKAKHVLLVPPDITRLNSRAGIITNQLWHIFNHKNVPVKILPALGTHVPMTSEEIDHMFGNEIPKDIFIDHHWRNDVVKLGEIPASRIAELSEGKINQAMPVSVNKHIVSGEFDVILSIGQIVPHEVIGMANYTKNILVGAGGNETINLSHFLGAAYGMERIMGRSLGPVRLALNEASDTFLKGKGIDYILTVVANKAGKTSLCGLYAGNDDQCYFKAAELSQKVNLDLMDKAIDRAVVYLDPEEFRTTWLGNKSVYRLRMAMADAGELIILAPALHGFGEDPEIDRLIRKYGYHGTEQTLKDIDENEDLRNNLSAAAHLIHGTSDGRFKITYCPGPGVSKEEIESVGFNYMTYDEAIKLYSPDTSVDGWNETSDSEKYFYVSNPALGLWSTRERFEAS